MYKEIPAELIFSPIDTSSFKVTSEVRKEVAKLLSSLPLSRRRDLVESSPGFKAELNIVKDLVVDMMAAKATMEVLENYLKEQSAENEWDLFMDSLTGAPPGEGWSKGTYGYFSERNLFGQTPNSRIESDLQLYSEEHGRRLTELKTTKGTKMDVGGFTALASIDREILIYYKMLVKMQNLLVLKTAVSKINPQLFRLEQAFLFTTLLWSKLKQEVKLAFRTQKGEAIPTILSISEELNPRVEGVFISYKIEISIAGIIKDYKRLYANKADLFTSPETRRLFFQTLRAIKDGTR